MDLFIGQLTNSDKSLNNNKLYKTWVNAHPSFFFTNYLLFSYFLYIFALWNNLLVSLTGIGIIRNTVLRKPRNIRTNLSYSVNAMVAIMGLSEMDG